jgi:hypothetical protein
MWGTTYLAMQHHKPDDQNPKEYALMFVTMKIMALWNVMPYCPVVTN